MPRLADHRILHKKSLSGRPFNSQHSPYCCVLLGITPLACVGGGLFFVFQGAVFMLLVTPVLIRLAPKPTSLNIA